MTSRRLAAALAATSLLWTACMHVPGSQLVNRSDPIYGRWQLNLVKSRLAPAPPWRSEALLIARDGDWQVRTTEFVYRDSIAKFPVRCKEDGRDYRAASGRTHALTRLEDRRWKETEKLNGVTVAEYDQVLSPDGRQLTVFHTSFDRAGKLLGTRVEVFDKIR
jgi:hypothetical protein